MRKLIARVLLSVVVVVVLLALAAGAYAAHDALAATHQLDVARSDLRDVLHGAALNSDTQTRVLHAGRLLDNASDRLRRDRRLLLPLSPLLHIAGVLPVIGPALEEAPELLGLAADTSTGGARLASGLRPLLAQTDPAAAETSTPPGQRLASALSEGAADLRAGDNLLRGAADRRRHLHPQRYRGPFSSLRTRLLALDADLPALVSQADLLAILPDTAQTLLGFRGPRTYLVLGQDSAELRPSGGFIGSAGLFTLDRGQLTYQEYRSAYDFDNLATLPLEPPLPLRVYHGTAGWSFIDGNWSPDFPSSAAQLDQFVEQSLGIRPDGVIALDNAAVTDLLRAIGPLDVAGFPQPLTADNWFEQTTQYLYTAQASLLNTVQPGQDVKSIGLGAVLQTMLSKAQTSHGPDLLAFLNGLRAAVADRHLQLAFAETPLATWSHALGADGALFPAPAGDVIAPVDADVGYSKDGPYIQRGLTYDVWLDASAVPQRAQLSLYYHNGVDAAVLADPLKRIGGLRYTAEDNRFTPVPGLFASYTRVYLPGTSGLDSVTGLQGPASITAEGGYRVVGGGIELLPGADGVVTLSYQPIPAQPTPGQYALTVVRQAGLDTLPAHIAIHLPTGSEPLSIPAGSRREGDAVIDDLVVTSPARLTLQLAQSGAR